MDEILYKALTVSEEPGKGFISSIENKSTESLPQNGTLINVLYSSLNYKDALSASGNKGVTKLYPHTPGIDAAGIVTNTNSNHYKSGDEVIVTGYDLGMNTSGGFGQYINVPEEWIVPKPKGITLEESMILGTAGFTAALAVQLLIRNNQKELDGPILVTGASGGVGSLSVAILSLLGFEVIACSGKPEAESYLKMLGAAKVIGREEVIDNSDRALLRSRWAGAIDTVGGNMLSSILKSCKPHGNIAVCGNVSSPLLSTTVFPFILNGVNLLGVNSATTPMPLRKATWEKLSSTWKPGNLHEIKIVTTINDLRTWIDEILIGKVQGRVVLKH